MQMTKSSAIKRVGLIAGSGKFPLFICRAAKNAGVNIVAIKIKDETVPDLAAYIEKEYEIELGQGKRLLEVLKKEDLKYAIMAGKITKTTILKQSFRMDEEARRILKNIIDKRDDTILKAIADRLKQEDIMLLDSTQFLKSFLARKEIYTKIRPDRFQKEDVDFGFKIAKEIAGLDIGQTVVVKDRAVIAVEAIEGTDATILRAGSLSSNCVIVKVAKPNQDMRFDVPTIGPATIQAMKKAHASVLAIESGRTLVLEKEAMIKEADEAGICIIAV